ncbi:MAG: nucleotide sugar dehydrogenase [Candidatus Heimdallarchaeota archaeon]|nr:nucleotide sugar dehydrogenase [Candidatus Heimdallarchaeota archaeon]
MKYFEMNNDSAVQSIRNRSLTIAVFGQGQIGLPISVVFLNAGYKVVGVDIDGNLVANLNNGIIPMIREPGVSEGIKRGLETEKYCATLSVEQALQDADVIVIIIPIILDENQIPNLTPLTELIEKIGRNLQKGQLLIQETTLPIGTTEDVLLPILEIHSGLSAGVDFGLGFSPERTYTGKVLQDITENYPKIIGGINSRSTERMALLYNSFVEKSVIKMSSARTAEAAKIFKGVFRDINIAIANEFSKISEKLDVDFYEVRNAVNSEPSGNILLPGAGVGGHCIPVYPHFLIQTAKNLGIKPTLMKAGREVNVSMPKHVVTKITQSVEYLEKDLKTAKIVLLGFSYRGNVKEYRYSPTIDIINQLKDIEVDAYLHDPLYSREEIREIIGVNFVENLEEALTHADCIVLLADHTEYGESLISKMDSLAKKPYIFVDTRNIYQIEDTEERKVYRIGV